MLMHIVGLLFVYTIDMFLPGDKLEFVCSLNGALKFNFK